LFNQINRITMGRKVSGYRSGDSPFFREETLHNRIKKFALSRGLVLTNKKTGKLQLQKRAVKEYINKYNELHDKHFTEIASFKFKGSDQVYLTFK